MLTLEPKVVVNVGKFETRAESFYSWRNGLFVLPVEVSFSKMSVIITAFRVLLLVFVRMMP